MKLKGLMERAKGLLDNLRTSPDATDAIKADRFGKRLFAEMRDEAPALETTIKNLGREIDQAEDIVRDTLLQFWQANPELRTRPEMAESHLGAHAVAGDVAGSPELESARRFTVHDKYGATMSAIGVSDKIKDWAKQRGEELKEAKQQADEAEERARQQEAQLQEAMQAAEQIDPDAPHLDEEFHGPLTPAQEQDRQAAGQLAAQAELTDAAAQALADARAQMEAAAAQAKKELAAPISQATKEVREKLEDEARTFNAWGIDPGELKKMSFEERAKFAARLRGSRIGKYLELVGRFKMMAAAQQVRKIEYGRDEVVGVEMTGDLSRVLAAEFAALAMGEDDLAELMELNFYLKWFEEQLLGRKFEGTEKVGKGAIICAIDNSGSMSGEDGHGITREVWAKAFAFALLDQAKRQRRDFVGINFSSRSQVSVHRFVGGKGSIADVMRFVEEFFGGGTDFEAPMDRAIEILADEFDQRGKAKADIVFITDDDCRVSSEWMRRYQERKRRLAFRTFGIAVGTVRPGGTLTALSDNVRGVTEFADPKEVKDIFQLL